MTPEAASYEQLHHVSWDEFWGDGRITEVNLTPAAAPHEQVFQPSHVRLGDLPLGSVALRSVM